MFSIFSNHTLKWKLILTALLLGLYATIFYLDSFILLDHANLLLPYIVGFMIGTFFLGTWLGLFMLVLSLGLSFFPRMYGAELSQYQIVDIVIKATFSLLIFALVVYLNKLYSRVKEMAILDSLTGLNNKRGFQFLANTILHQAKRNKAMVCCVYLDIDNFKQVNDTKGHKTGDNVLVDLARVLQGSLRESDICARIGGDEFCIIILDTGEESVHAIIQRIQESFRELSLRKKWPTSLSIGAFFSQDEYTLPYLMSEADKIMYQAKQKGKNRVEVSGEPLFAK